MSLLKNLGTAIQKGTSLLGIGSVLGDRLGGLSEIARLAIAIEVALSGSKGIDKFNALRKLSSQIIRTSEIVSGKEIADENLFQKAIDQITQGVVDLLNSLKQR